MSEEASTAAGIGCTPLEGPDFPFLLHTTQHVSRKSDGAGSL